ncbi:MAG: IMPACT family protein [Propionibacteriaceae bacterium]|nr:IMPACT family protein [Propionibacteriaceae bacterium]
MVFSPGGYQGINPGSFLGAGTGEDTLSGVSSMPVKGYQVRHETEIKKSRFLTSIGRTDTETEARAFIARVRAQFPDARHHCTAYIVEDHGVRLARSSDDGEPAGTAGMPMLNCLVKEDVINVTAVVTRYFGGIKLGASGLTRAYSGCVAAVIRTMERVVPQTRQIWAVTLGLEEMGRIEETLLRSGVRILSRNYTEVGVDVRLTSDTDPGSLFARIFPSHVRPVHDGEEIVEVRFPHV